MEQGGKRERGRWGRYGADEGQEWVGRGRGGQRGGEGGWHARFGGLPAVCMLSPPPFDEVLVSLSTHPLTHYRVLGVGDGSNDSHTYTHTVTHTYT
jgi:hypothetical protein